MKYLLDTNICIFLINHRLPALQRRFEKVVVGEIAVSAITVAELRYGVEKSSQSQRNHAALEKFLLPLVILPYHADAAGHYGRLRTHLERKGTPIGGMDMLIAAHALAYDLVVVTNNTSEFRRVPGLRVEDWTA